MTAYPWLWIVFTIIAAAAQTVRNAMQRELTGTLGTLGATHVRFLFGFPFALVFLAALMLWTGARLPHTGWAFWLWVLEGSAAQIAATALMLVAMGERSFVVTIAYLKTEPIQVAIFGLIFLGDKVTAPMAAAIVVATAGVLIMSTKPGGMVGGVRPMLLGLASGGTFALSAIGYRGAILSLGLANYMISATFTLAVGLVATTIMLSLYLLLRAPGVMTAIFKVVATLSVRRLHGRVRLAILVSCLRHRHGRERADACFGGSPVRAACRALCLWPAHHGARSRRHGACRRRRRAA